MHRVALVTATAVASAIAAALTSGEAAMLATAARVAQDIRAVVAPEYWDRARCVVVVPAEAGASGPARGVLGCRAGDDWSAPLFVELEQGTRGARVPAAESDVVLLVMTAQGAQKLLDSPADLSGTTIAPGPIGQHAAKPADAARPADVLAYARHQGLFTGADLATIVLRPDLSANRDAYGDAATPRSILALRAMSAPTQASAFLTALGARESMVPSPAPTIGTPASPVGSAGTPPTTPPASAAPAPAASAEPDVRARVVALQQAIDRLIVDAETSTVGTTEGGGATDTVPVSRERLMQLRRQLDAILAALDKRP